MSIGPFAPLALTLLLAACAAGPAATPPAQSQAVEKPRQAVPTEQPPAAHLRALHGSLSGVPAGAEVELALLAVNERGLSKRLLGTIQLHGNGARLPFRLEFNPQAFPADRQVVLRGRATQSGRLILRLPPQAIHSAADQNLGELHLEPAP